MDLDIERYKARFSGQWKAKAMEDIWQGWYRRLAAFIRTSYGARGQIDDLMQEVMTKVFLGLERYDQRFALSTWLYTITRNTCISHFASEKRSRAESALSLVTEPQASGSVEARLIESEIEREVAVCLDCLAVEDRGIAFLAFYEQCSYRHIAEVFGLPLHGVKNRIHRIRCQVRPKLEDYRESN